MGLMYTSPLYVVDGELGRYEVHRWPVIRLTYRTFALGCAMMVSDGWSDFIWTNDCCIDKHLVRCLMPV